MSNVAKVVGFSSKVAQAHADRLRRESLIEEATDLSPLTHNPFAVKLAGYKLIKPKAKRKVTSKPRKTVRKRKVTNVEPASA